MRGIRLTEEDIFYINEKLNQILIYFDNKVDKTFTIDYLLDLECDIYNISDYLKDSKRRKENREIIKQNPKFKLIQNARNR